MHNGDDQVLRRDCLIGDRNASLDDINAAFFMLRWQIEAGAGLHRHGEIEGSEKVGVGAVTPKRCRRSRTCRPRRRSCAAASSWGVAESGAVSSAFFWQSDPGLNAVHCCPSARASGAYAQSVRCRVRESSSLHRPV